MIKEIRYLTNSEIDRAKWDKAVNDAPNGFIYCHSIFLDALCKWDALVAGDYQYIMPLPFKKKLGIWYIYTPYFIGQLGIISSNVILPQTITHFIDNIPAKFKYIDLDLNESNEIDTLKIGSIRQRNNYVLALDQPYHQVESQYSKDGKKNLRQANSYALQSVQGIEIRKVIDFFKTAYGSLNPGIGNALYNRFEKACSTAVDTGLGFTMGVYEKDELVATAFFGKDNKRIYYMAGAPSEKGRRSNAQHILINEVIKKYAGSGLLLDFEGSDLPNVAAFYKKFSPLLKTYPSIRINRLPFFVKWLKK